MCGDGEETFSHFLGQCPAIAQIRGQYFQDYYLSVNDIFDNQHISTIINFTNRTKCLVVPEELDQTGVLVHSIYYNNVLLINNIIHTIHQHPSLHNVTISTASSCRTATPQRWAKHSYAILSWTSRSNL